jgi:hypothetical protein
LKALEHGNLLPPYGEAYEHLLIEILWLAFPFVVIVLVDPPLEEPPLADPAYPKT